jgi:hypothetical protein
VWLRPTTRPSAENSNSDREIPAEPSNCLDEAMEKRLPIAMVVNLAPAFAQSGNVAEMTYTDNVSAHGACVVPNRSWQPGEVAEITSLLDQIAMRGKVVYCRKQGEDRYAVGLKFQNCPLVWSVYLKYAGQAQETVAPRQRVAR